MARHKKTVAEKENQPFATRIRTLIDSNPLITQADVATAIGKSRQVVSQYCHGESEPAFDTLVRIAAFFGVTIDYLLGVTDTKTTRPDMQVAVLVSGITEENMAFLERCKHEKPSDAPFFLRQQSLDLVNELIEMVRCDAFMAPAYTHLVNLHSDEAMQQMGIELCYDLVKLSALEVGRAVEKNLLNHHWKGFSDYGND